MPKREGKNSKPNVNNKNNIRNVNDTKLKSGATNDKPDVNNTNNTLTVNITCSKDGNDDHMGVYKVDINGNNFFKIDQTFSGAMVKFKITECDKDWNSKENTPTKTIYYDVDMDNDTPYHTTHGQTYMYNFFKTKSQDNVTLQKKGGKFSIQHTYRELFEKRPLVLRTLNDLSQNDVEKALTFTTDHFNDAFEIITEALKYNDSKIKLEGKNNDEKAKNVKNNLNDVKKAVQTYADDMKKQMDTWKTNTEKKGKKRFLGKEKVSELLNVLDKARLIQTENKQINVDYTNYANKNYNYNDFKPFNYQKKRFYTRNGLFDTLAHGFKSVANSIGGMMRNLYDKFAPQKLSSWNINREMLNLNTIREQIIKKASWYDKI